MAFSSSLGTRTTAVVTAVATTCCAVITAPATLSPAFATTPEVADSARFLADQLAAGTGEPSGENLLPGPRGASATTPNDVGMSQDYLFTLKSLGAETDQLNRSYTATKNNLQSHLYFGDIVDANRLAKTVALDATMGSLDAKLVQALESTVQADGQVKDLQAGQPATAVTNFGQSWAVIALKQAGKEDLARSAARFLSRQQCVDGGIPLDQQNPPQCTSVDPDSTALAAQAFAFVLGANDPATTSAIEYLKNNQAENGGMNSRFSGVNTNTTALAAGAFVAVGDKDAFSKAHRYLEAARLTGQAAPSLRGGFAQTAEKVSSTTSVDDSIRRTSGQAALAFAGYNYVGSEPLTAKPSEVPPTTTPRPSGNDSSGDSPVGLAFGLIAAVVAVIAAIAAAMNSQLLRGF